MERCFKVTKSSQFFQECEEFKKLHIEQSKLIREFFKKHNITAKKYHVAASGFTSTSFNNGFTNDKRLYIIPSEDDIKLYDKILTKADESGRRSFMRGSTIAKDFLKYCIETNMIVNLYAPDLTFYFNSLEDDNFNIKRITGISNDYFYMRIISDNLDANELPEGFQEINAIEFYNKYEESMKGK